MKKIALIILVLIVAAAAVLYFVYDKKENVNEPAQQAIDPNYVEYTDSINHVKLMHHKDWQATSSTGFIRLMPKSSPSGEVKYVQIELWATDAKVKQLGLDNANSAPIGNQVVRFVTQETPWKDAQGKTLPYKTTKTYMHWPATPERNVIFEVSPGVLMGNVEEPVKKIVESLKFDQ